MYSGAHEHTAWPFISRQMLLGPHGDGLHGLVLTGATLKYGRDYFSIRISLEFHLFLISNLFVPVTVWHIINAFPLVPAGQLHIGV